MSSGSGLLTGDSLTAIFKSRERLPIVGMSKVARVVVAVICFVFSSSSVERAARAQESDAPVAPSLESLPSDPGSVAGSTTIPAVAASASALHAPQEKRVYELTFDDLAFKMEKGTTFAREMLTPKINEYNGSTIRLRGFIRPSFTQSGLTKFVFVRDNQECCFGPGAALYDCVLVKLADGNKTDFTVRPVTIEGEFYLKEYEGPDGKIWSIYRLKEGAVK